MEAWVEGEETMSEISVDSGRRLMEVHSITGNPARARLNEAAGD
jgi:hypothetical protein